MTIDEAIKHCEEKAQENYLQGMLCHANPNDEELNKCIECAKEHEQLKEWLEEYKVLREKATPKPVVKLEKSQYGYTHQCPSCKQLAGTIVYDVKVRRITEIEHDNYCCSCGQALDWSEEK